MSYYAYLYGVTSVVLDRVLWLAQKEGNEAIIEEIRKMKALDTFFKEKNPRIENCSDVHADFQEIWKK